LLSRAGYNGMTAYEFHYSENNLWTRWDLFKIDPSDNSLSVYVTFDYDGMGRLVQLAVFDMPGNVPRTRTLLEYDNEGKLTGHSYYDLLGPNPSMPEQTAVYTYNAQNQINVSTVRDKNGGLVNRKTLSYFPNGVTKETNDYEETVTHQLRLKGRALYSLPNTDIIKGWEKIAVIPVDGYEIARQAQYETIQRYTYNNGVLTHNTGETMSAKEYNSDGTLKRVTSTTKFILPVNPDIVNNWEYEYIQQ